MKFTNYSTKWEYVKEIFDTVVDKYTGMLNNKLVWLAKVQQLEVILDEIEEDDTNAMIILVDPMKYNYQIFLDVNLKDSKERIAFVVAHELAHLLFTNINDVLKTSDKSEDGSTAFTAFQRLKDGEVYGDIFEEAAADYLAKIVVDRLDFEDENGTSSRKFETNEKKNRIDFVERFSTCFGESLTKCECIDDVKEHAEGYEVKNIFWYSVATQSLSYIINEYDRTMGNGAYRRLNEDVESYLKGCSSSNAAKRELKKFSKLIA